MDYTSVTYHNDQPKNLTNFLFYKSKVIAKESLTTLIISITHLY